MRQITSSENIRSIIDAIRKSPEEKKRYEEARAEEARKEAERAKQERIELLNLRWRLANVPSNYHHSRLVPFTSAPRNNQDKINMLNQLKVLEQIKNIDDVTKHNIIFHGGYGKGKTHFATCLVRKVLWNNQTAGFVRAREYCDFKNKKSDRVDFFENIRFLVLDEVGDFDMPQWEKMWLKELIIARDANGFKTLVTTNLDSAGIREFFRGRAEDRLLNSATRFVNFDVVNGACSLRGVR
ncbi:hypothetical protein MNB_SV-14-1031 [hydrothermal vent metagenome]|uniref:IstB-like ATP-binding domain-containing protein n=1 Tax=hydrothermal vent metagenome TaxID=652676 RepID=A0A1W1CCI6_9ZZZZ